MNHFGPEPQYQRGINEVARYPESTDFRNCCDACLKEIMNSELSERKTDGFKKDLCDDCKQNQENETI